ncbi:MAG: efflux transporter outer membrane subunit [Pseudomonadota bacterium]
MFKMVCTTSVGKWTYQKKSLATLFLWLSVGSLGLTACSFTPHYQRPAFEAPQQFSVASEDWVKAGSTPLTLDLHWWRHLNDPELDQWQQLLLKENNSLKAAHANYLRAKAVADVAPRAFLPTLGVSADSARSKRDSSSSNNNATTSTNKRVSTSSSLTFTTHWEADLWGGIHAQYEASIIGAEAAQATLASALLSLQASLAQTAVQLRIADQQLIELDILRKSYAQILQLTESRYKAGAVSIFEVEQIRISLQTAELQYREAQSQRAQYEHTVAILVGKIPGQWHIQPRPVALNIPAISTELPSTLLERRPDIAVAERNVAVANARIGVAKAAYFPALSFDASLGNQADGWAKWFSAPLSLWSLGSSVAFSILDSGQRKLQTEQAKADYEATVATYRDTVLTAFKEVEDSLVSLKSLQDQQGFMESALNSTEKRLTLVEQQKAVGTVSGLEVLNARLTQSIQKRSLIDVQGARLLATVQLVKALGGGVWNTAEGK